MPNLPELPNLPDLHDMLEFDPICLNCEIARIFELQELPNCQICLICPIQIQIIPVVGCSLVVAVEVIKLAQSAGLVFGWAWKNQWFCITYLYELSSSQFCCKCSKFFMLWIPPMQSGSQCREIRQLIALL